MQEGRGTNGGSDMGRMWIWAIVGVLAASPAWSVEVHDVRLWRAPDHTRIVFDLSGPAEHKLIVLENPGRLLDVPAADQVGHQADLLRRRLQVIAAGPLSSCPIPRASRPPFAGGAWRP